MDDSVRDSYDDNAERYTAVVADALDRAPIDRAHLEAFGRHASSRTGVVADVGCGPGYVTHFLTGLGVPMIGLDLSPKMIEIATRSYPDSMFWIGDLANLPFAPMSLGGIVARYSIIHLPPTELTDVFRRWFGALEPGASALVSFFGATRSTDHGLPFDHAVATAYQLFPNTIARELQTAGFGHVDVSTRGPLDGERPLDHATIVARRVGH